MSWQVKSCSYEQRKGVFLLVGYITVEFSQLGYQSPLQSI